MNYVARKYVLDPSNEGFEETKEKKRREKKKRQKEKKKKMDHDSGRTRKFMCLTKRELRLA